MAKHAIKRGEEILDCYGPHHLSHGKADRQKTISSAFMFQCQCQGCDHQWPLWSEIEARLSPGEMAQLGTSLSKYQVNILEFISASSSMSTFRQTFGNTSSMLPEAGVWNI